MHSVVFLSRLYYPHIGGVEKHVSKLSRELVKRGFQVTLLTEQFSPDLPLKEVVENITIIRLPYRHRDHKLATWKWMWQQRQIFSKASLVHVHDIYWQYLLGRFYQLNLPSFVTFHGYEGVDPPDIKQKWHRQIVNKLAKSSISVGKFIDDWYGIKSDKIIYGAADLKPAHKVRYKKAVFLGRLSQDAGALMYVRALKYLPGFSLEIYGDGDLSRVIKREIKQYKLKVKIFGWKEDVAAAYQSSRYAFVSRYLAIIEAMQSKRLVIAVYNNRIKYDYLNCHPQAKNMIIAGSEHEIADKLNELNSHKEAEMINVAYEWARQQTWDSVAQTYISLWKAYV